MPDWLTEGLKFLAVVAVAWITARLTMPSARQQALETERLKLWHQLTIRKLDEYGEISRQFMDEVMELPLQATVPASVIVTFMNHGVRLGRAAEGVPTDSDRDALSLPIIALLEAVRMMIDALFLDVAKKQDAVDNCWHVRLRSQVQVMSAVAALDGIVHWAAKRALAAAESDEPPSQLPERDADRFKQVLEHIAKYRAEDLGKEQHASEADPEA